MTIRSGGGARGRSQAHPAERGTSDEDWQPHYDAETHGPGPGGSNCRSSVSSVVVTPSPLVVRSGGGRRRRKGDYPSK